jgi:transcriptional regulator with XRE-family HTH domain
MPKRPVGPSAEDLAERIRAERIRLGLTQREAAERLGVSRSTYRQLETAANPTAITLVGLVRVLGMRPEVLLPEFSRGA